MRKLVVTGFGGQPPIVGIGIISNMTIGMDGIKNFISTMTEIYLTPFKTHFPPLENSKVRDYISRIFSDSDTI